MELVRNLHIARVLESHGMSVYLPQRDAGISYDALDRGEDKVSVRRRIFAEDSGAVANCDALVCLLDGRVPDEGACIELGMAFALGKPCIGYKTDRRAMDVQGDNNIMIDGCFNDQIARSKPELVSLLHRLTNKK
jgi:nucleoside 2-deoxyribosyltransferase